MDSTGGEPSIRNRAVWGTDPLARLKRDPEPSLKRDSAIRTRQADEESEESARLWKGSMERRHLTDIIVAGVLRKRKTHEEAKNLLLESSLKRDSAFRTRQADEESEESARLWKGSMERRHLNDIIVAGVVHKRKTHEEAKNLLLESSLKRDSALRDRKAALKRVLQAGRAAQRKKPRKLMSLEVAKYKARAMANAKAKKAKAKDEEAWEAEVHVTEAVRVGSSKSAMEDEVMGKDDISQQLLKDPDCDDENDEMIDRGKSATEEEHMPSVGKNPSDRVEVSVTAWEFSSWEQALLEFPGVDFTWIPREFCLEFNRKFIFAMKRQPDSLDIQNALTAIQASFGNSTRIGGKSVIDEVISPETEESGTEAVKKAEEGVLLVGPTGLEPLMAKKAQEGGLLIGRASTSYKLPKLQQALLEFPGVDFSWIPLEFWSNFYRQFRITMKRESECLDIQNALAAIQANFGNSTRIGGKSVIDEVISPETEESGTEAVKEADSALLVGMDSTGGESLTWKEAEEAMEELWQIKQHIVLLGIKEKFAKKEAALLAGMYSTHGKSSMWKQAEEEAGKKSEMQWHAEEDMLNYFASLPPKHCQRALKQYYVMKYEAAEWKALVAEVEKREALLASQEKLARWKKAKAKAKAALAKAKANEEAMKTGRPEESVTEAGRPEESVTEAGKAEEAVAEAGKAVADMHSVGGNSFIREKAENELGKRLGMQLCAEEDYFPKGVHGALLGIKEKSAKKKNNLDKETLRQLVKDFSDKFDISMRSTSAIVGHTTMVESDKLLLQPADPSATNSLTRLGVQDDLHHERGKSSATTLVNTVDKDIADEAKNFDLYRRYWESARSKTRGSFEHMTALSSMQFTCYTPGLNFPRNGAASSPATLQIFSIKLARIAGGLQWPLSVYGVVAVRDVVDYNRNFLFSCDSNNSQKLTEDDPFLHLIGPSRAVVYTDKVHFEIELRVKGTEESEDKALITEARRYHEAFGVGMSTVCFKNYFCTLELCVEVVRKTTQATILGVQVNKGRGQPCPFEYGARVTCYPVPGKWMFPDNKLTYVTYPASGEIVMVDSKDGARLKGCDGYLHLPRNVISVETEGRLDVDIIAYSKSGEIAAQEFVCFQPKFSKISRRKCYVRGSMVVITVAWSLVATDKRKFMALG